MLLLVSETRDHGSHAVTIDDVLASLGTSTTLVFSLAFSPTVSNLLDDARGNLQPEGDWVDLGELATKLLIMTRQAMRRNIPKTVAAMTGGEYELFKSHSGFESRMTEFTDQLYSRYLLSFEPKAPHPGLHQITVRLRGPGNARILARTSYWAKAAQGMDFGTSSSRDYKIRISPLALQARISNLPTFTGSRNRRGPALPGLK